VQLGSGQQRSDHQQDTAHHVRPHVHRLVVKPPQAGQIVPGTMTTMFS
jgi:hypothetical protein